MRDPLPSLPESLPAGASLVPARSVAIEWNLDSSNVGVIRVTNLRTGDRVSWHLDGTGPAPKPEQLKALRAALESPDLDRATGQRVVERLGELAEPRIEPTIRVGVPTPERDERAGLRLALAGLVDPAEYETRERSARSAVAAVMGLTRIDVTHATITGAPTFLLEQSGAKVRLTVQIKAPADLLAPGAADGEMVFNSNPGVSGEALRDALQQVIQLFNEQPDAAALARTLNADHALWREVMVALNLRTSRDIHVTPELQAAFEAAEERVHDPLSNQQFRGAGGAVEVTWARGGAAHGELVCRNLATQEAAVFTLPAGEPAEDAARQREIAAILAELRVGLASAEEAGALMARWERLGGTVAAQAADPVEAAAAIDAFRSAHAVPAHVTATRDPQGIGEIIRGIDSVTLATHRPAGFDRFVITRAGGQCELTLSTDAAATRRGEARGLLGFRLEDSAAGESRLTGLIGRFAAAELSAQEEISLVGGEAGVVQTLLREAALCRLENLKIRDASWSRERVAAGAIVRNVEAINWRASFEGSVALEDVTFDRQRSLTRLGFGQHNTGCVIVIDAPAGCRMRNARFRDSDLVIVSDKVQLTDVRFDRQSTLAGRIAGSFERVEIHGNALDLDMRGVDIGVYSKRQLRRCFSGMVYRNGVVPADLNALGKEVDGDAARSSISPRLSSADALEFLQHTPLTGTLTMLDPWRKDAPLDHEAGAVRIPAGGGGDFRIVGFRRRSGRLNDGYELVAEEAAEAGGSPRHTTLDSPYDAISWALQRRRAA